MNSKALITNRLDYQLQTIATMTVTKSLTKQLFVNSVKYHIYYAILLIQL